MANYLIDSNILSQLFKKKPNQQLLTKLKATFSAGEDVFISCISYYEVKRGLYAINAINELKQLNIFCESYSILWLEDTSILDKASLIYSELKNQGTLINDADILIAATAILKDLILVSNDNDFKKVKDLKQLSMEEWIQL